MKNRELVRDKPNKAARATAGATLAVLALLSACSNSQESVSQSSDAPSIASITPEATAPTTDTQPANSTPGLGEVSPSPMVTPDQETQSISVSGDVNEVIRYTGSEVPPAPTNYAEAKGFAYWYYLNADMSPIWEVVENGNANFLVKNKIGVAELQASIDINQQMVDYITDSGLLNNPQTEKDAIIFLRASQMNQIISQSILENSEVSGMLATSPQTVTLKDLESRLNEDPSGFVNHVIPYMASDELVPEELLVLGGTTEITDEIIQNYYETTVVADPKPEDRIITGLSRLSLALGTSCAVKLAGGSTSRDINNFVKSGVIADLLTINQ